MSSQSNNLDFDAEAAFAKAAQDFRNSLSDEEKESFKAVQNPDDMIASLRDHIDQLVAQKKRSRLLKTMSKVDAFCSRIKAYFEVINLFVSSNPDFAAIIWGSIRLIFQLSSQFVLFFERLASMFGDIIGKLPRYTKQMKMIKTRMNQSNEYRESHKVLLKSLVFVYTNIIQFCHEAFRLFTSKRMGIRYTASNIMTLFWTPFDDRFSGILGSIERHQKNFDNNISDLCSEEMLLYYNKMDEEIEKNEKYREENKFQLQMKENEALSTNIRNIRYWIGAVDWAGPFEAAKRRRADETGSWVISDKTYRAWLAEVAFSDASANFRKRVMVVSGKPGYGKTILSTCVIEDLASRPQGIFHAEQTNDFTVKEPIVAYYYFDKQQPAACCSVEALRAVLAQIIQARQQRKDLIDVVSCLMKDTGLGQIKASRAEITSILQVFASRFEPFYLVIDGLDECSDLQDLLLSLYEIAAGTACKIVMFTRPHLRTTTSKTLGGQPLHISLSASGNLRDIKVYLRPKATALLQSELIAGHFSVDSLVSHIASRANSMFLWVVLLVGYLECPTLSPQERLETLKNASRLEGLDAMFLEILRFLQQNIPRVQWAKIQKVFRWLSVARRPWTVDALKTALAVQDNRPITGSDILQDFESSILYICGSLVEVRADRTVTFIHLSVQEFLTGAHKEFGGSDFKSPFFVQIEVAHCVSAIVYLSYLTNDVPHEPLSGDPEVTADIYHCEEGLPLLRLAASNWIYHASEFFTRARQSCKPRESISWEGHAETLLSILSAFASDPNCLTSLIEATWAFSAPSDMEYLSVLLDLDTDSRTSNSARNFVDSCERISSLALTFSALNKDWGHVLRQQPNEIWMPSINSFLQSKMLISTDAVVITPLGSTEPHDSILIATQVSASGAEVAKFKVWSSTSETPGSKATATKSHPSESQVRIPTWKASYEIWSLQTMTVIFHYEFDVPQNQLLDSKFRYESHNSYGKKVSTCALDPREAGRHRFPVAISSSLNVAIILGIILRMRRTPDGSLELACEPQLLLASEERHHLAKLLRMQINTSQYFGHDDLCRGKLSEHPKYTQFQTCYDWNYGYFSPDERYLVTIETQEARLWRQSGFMIISCYEDTTKDSASCHKLLTRIGVEFRNMGAADEDTKHLKKQFLCFHPDLPILAVCTCFRTTIWKFTEQNSQLIFVYKDPLDNMMFSPCGNHLYGTLGDSTTCPTPVCVDISRFLSRPSVRAPMAVTNVSRYSTTDSLSNIVPTNSIVQTVAAPVLTIRNGMEQISALRQCNDVGSITEHVLRQDGTGIMRTITRLPQSISINKSSSTLVHTNADTARLVLNMAPQDSYSQDDQEDLVLPLLIDRRADSIPTLETVFCPTTRRVIETKKRCIENQGELHAKRKRGDTPERQKSLGG